MPNEADRRLSERPSQGADLNTQKIGFADTLRGIAALAVLVAHYVVTFWVFRADAAALGNAPALGLEEAPIPVWAEALYPSPFMSYGGFGVALFFLISGFVIPYAFKNYSSTGFLIGRVFRIFPTYLAGFSVTVAALWISSWYWSLPFPYTLKEVLIHAVPGLRDFAWSKHIDYVVWTLEVEIKFYIIAALLAPLFRRKGREVFVAPVALAAVAVGLATALPFLETSHYELWKLAWVLFLGFQYIIFMFIGVVFHYHFTKALSGKQAVPLAGFLLAAFLAVWIYGPIQSSFVHGAPAYVVALALFSICYLFPRLVPRWRVLTFLADISYPLYVVHGIGGLVMQRILSDWGVPPSLTILMTVAAAIAASYMIHCAVERPTQMIGKALGKRTGAPALSETPALDVQPVV